MRANDVRDLVRSCGGDSSDAGTAARAPIIAAGRIMQFMGLVNKNGKRNIAESNLTYAKKPYFLKEPVDDRGEKIGPRLRPDEMSIKALAIGFMGPDKFESLFAPDSVTYQQVMPAAAQHKQLIESAGRDLWEDNGAGSIMASAFADINAWTGTVAGLLEISMMEAWENPAYIVSENIIPDVGTRMFEGKKFIGVTRLGDVAEERLPGQPTKRAQIGERWVQMPRTVENALAVEVSQEAVYLDLTGDLLRQANDVTEWLRWRKEIRCIDSYIGNPNLPTSLYYNFDGNTYFPYITNGYYNNDLPANELLAWEAAQNSLILFRDMLDPNTGTRVMIKPNYVVVNLEKKVTARAIFGDLPSSGVQVRSPYSGANPQDVTNFAPPYKGDFQVLESPLIYQRLTDVGITTPGYNVAGMGLSPVIAAKYWWMGEKDGRPEKHPIVYMQNWPLRVQTASPGQVDMIDRGVVLFVKADERGIPMWMEPRRIVRNKPN